VTSKQTPTNRRRPPDPADIAGQWVQPAILGVGQRVGLAETVRARERTVVGVEHRDQKRVGDLDLRRKAPDPAVRVRNVELAAFGIPFEDADAAGLLRDLEPLLGAQAFGDLDDDSEDADRLSALVADRHVVEIEPAILHGAVSVQRQALLAQRERAAGQHRVQHAAVQIGCLGPAFENLRAEQAGVAAAGEAGIGVVVDQDAVRPPEHNHRIGRAESQRDRAAQALRPGFDRPQRGRRPVEAAYQRACFAAMGEEDVDVGHVHGRHGR